VRIVLPLLIAPLFLLTAPLQAQDAPPPDLAAVETARSRACVPALAHLDEVNAQLEPLFRRADRINALASAITVEDTTYVVPFDRADPLEDAVREWFAADLALALRYVDTQDESIMAQRDQGREQILQRLRDALGALEPQADAILLAAGDVDTAADECEGAIFVRSAVLEACQGVDTALCAAARSTEPNARYSFVDAAVDLWEVEEMRVWSEPLPLHRGADGEFAGVRTGVLARRGNLILVVGMEPMIRPRTSVTAEEAAQFDANLDSLGFVFEDERFIMAPALTVQFNVTAPLGGETHYLLHFGNLSDPANDVIWTAPSAGGVGIQAMFPMPPQALMALAQGEPVNLTAVRVLEDGKEADTVFTLELTDLGQTRAIGGLLTYIGSGQLGRDIKALVPAEPGGR